YPPWEKPVGATAFAWLHGPGRHALRHHARAFSRQPAASADGALSLAGRSISGSRGSPGRARARGVAMASADAPGAPGNVCKPTLMLEAATCPMVWRTHAQIQCHPAWFDPHPTTRTSAVPPP